MTKVAKRGRTGLAPFDAFEAFERRFEDWARGAAIRWPDMLSWDLKPEQLIKVDEYRENDDVVVRAELPGFNPADVKLSVSDGVLRLEAERREEETSEEKGYVRKELRTGAFLRTLPLPAGVQGSDVKADYKDGILTIRVHTTAETSSTQVPITKA